MFEGLFIQQYQKKFRKVPFPGLQCLLCGHFSIEILDPITHHIVVTFTLDVSWIKLSSLDHFKIL